MRLYCATTNKGKLREFRRAVEQHGDGQFTIDVLPGLNQITPPEETGSTFEENAILKACYYSANADRPLFVDDSGLAVDSLDGEPGVLSARYAGENATDEENNRLLLERMRHVENRAARFVCVVALAERGELVKTFRGVVEGILAHEPRGENGFGYDPLFYHPPFECTLAEVDAARKLSVSHRGKAIHRMLCYLTGKR